MGGTDERLKRWVQYFSKNPQNITQEPVNGSDQEAECGPPNEKEIFKVVLILKTIKRPGRMA